MVVKKIVLITVILVAIFFFLFLYPHLYHFLFHLPQKEVVVIGLDGGDYGIVQSLVEKDKLPNLERFIAEGIFEPFYTTSKLDSYSAWNSLVTCNGNSLWNMIKEKNVSFGTVHWSNVPEIGLFMVPDEFEGKDEWPKDVYDSKALLIFKNPVTEFFRKVYWVFKITFPQNKAEKDLVYEFYLLDRNAREFFYLREKFKPTLSFLVLSSPLRIEQYFWMYAYPEKFGNYITEKGREKYGKVIEDYFIKLDNFLGKLHKSDKTILVVSNRGVKEKYPPKVVDKIDINKVLKEIGMLKFDYRGEIDFSKTKAYTLEEGLDQELKIFIIRENFTEIKIELEKVFTESISLPSGQKIFTVEDFEDGIILKRNISLVIEDDRFSISNKILTFNDFILRRIISAVPEEIGFLIVNKKVELLEKIKSSEDFCEVVLNLIS